MEGNQWKLLEVREKMFNRGNWVVAAQTAQDDWSWRCGSFISGISPSMFLFSFFMFDCCYDKLWAEEVDWAKVWTEEVTKARVKHNNIHNGLTKTAAINNPHFWDWTTWAWKEWDMTGTWLFSWQLFTCVHFSAEDTWGGFTKFLCQSSMDKENRILCGHIFCLKYLFL